MKFYLLFTFAIAYLIAFTKAQQCDELNLDECVRIRKETRDQFCASKPEETYKCNCVYDTFIVNCYDLCKDNEKYAGAREQMEAEMNAQCSAANLEPDNIPANVYNEVGLTATTTPSINPMTSTAAGNGSTQTNISATKDDTDGAEITTFYTTLIVANILLAISLLV
ncbi:hypothetical protein BCR32DRAFT_325780 [Anaeromyces robustus]|uniref:Extracellular membrane protein CFEM domain-containing protein n=1 Tax=Anaeromyces robustus TaxID=1754192 RepID=A0A1Y1XG80_9FUNG|nr:hypothetical protein BCR32DRAFT_325780 [Anaeromyces robustus]|eukprot:ORX84769.1 hypothetical protein BCR32DRAFT_325780 [Anaeromyces robustus]